jgi:NAD dependent epimerase/dehydratase family enzyme
MLGKAGTELLLPSQKISPERLLADGFVFRDNTIAQAIERNIVAG